MSKTYNAITSEHYAAFRPSLHAPILSKAIIEYLPFNYGLDVGCGTGRSTVAMTEYCNTVLGIDPSKEMLDKAVQNPKIKYLKGFLKELALGKNSFDLIGFAGSLFYAKSQRLCDAVVRIGKPGSKIIIYDFEVVMEDSLEKLDLLNCTSSIAHYDHEVNFSGLDKMNLRTLKVEKNKVNLSVSASDLAHLVLSEKVVYETLEKKWKSEVVFKKVLDIFRTISSGKNHLIEANIFYSVYENIKKH